MRTRLNDRLARAASFPVTLIVAPAGFGKSVALRDFLLASRMDAVRYDVRREDDTLMAFALRLSEALAPIVPGAIAAFPSMQQRAMEAPDPARLICSWFAEHLSKTVGTIVVDDLHFAAADPTVFAFLGALIDRTCERISWIIASRSDAGLPIASWLAYGRMDRAIGESDLRFTVEEALAAAEEAEPGVAPAEVRSLVDLTEGWPVAMAIALRTHTHAADLRDAATREMVYRYLAEQIFASLSDPQREFLLASSIFPAFDVEIAQALGGTPEFIGELRRGVAFLNETAPGQYRYHDLFRDFLESELLRRGEAAWRHAVASGAALLEERGDVATALSMYARARHVPYIGRLVERFGFALFERGHAEALAFALNVLPEETRVQSASVLGLRAMLDAASGRFDVARRGFTTAIDRATDEALRLELVHRYALELVRHDEDCIALLEPYASDDSIAPQLRAPLLATLATAFARAYRAREASDTMTLALDALGPIGNDAVRARVYQQAAFVQLLDSTRQRAREFANVAVELALAHNLHEVAVRAYSVLYTIAYDDADDPIAALAILDRLLECARKGASSQARVFGLMASCWIEAERGDEAALERIDRALDAEPGGLPRVQVEALLPALALRAAWNRDFTRSLALLNGVEAGPSDDRRAYRASELALYAFAAGAIDDGELAYDAALEALARWSRPTRRAFVAQLNVAFADLQRGHVAAAHRRIAEIENAAPASMRRVRALAHAARTLYRLQLGQIERAVWLGALERLRAEQYGGLARLLEAIPFAESSEGSYASLTGAEREVLSLLATGASSKEVAARSGRSARTVDTHIRSICQKLNCRGRQAAIALATQAGWVHT